MSLDAGGMVRIGFIGMLCVLVGCDTPAVGFVADRKEIVEVGPHRFQVYLKEDRAQAVRLNQISLGQTKEATAAARTAVQQASGCEIGRVLDGSDQVLLKVELDCN